MSDTMEEWLDAVANVITNICDEKIKEPQITEMLKPWDTRKDIDMVFLKVVRDFAVGMEELIYLATYTNSLSSVEKLLYKLVTIKEEADYGISANIILKIMNADLSVVQIDNLLYKVRDWHEKTGGYNMDAVNYLLALRGEKKFAPVPKWVSIKEGENLALLQTVSPGQSYEASKSKNEYFIKQAHDIFYEIEKDRITGQGIELSLEEALNSVLSSYSDAENNESVSASRVFGPMNRFMDQDCISNPNKTGPCRMLECLCREIKDEPYQGVVEMKYNTWFIGKCQNCLCQIRDLSHALRYPVKDGGWEGCYCSLDCLKEDIAHITEDTNLRLDSMMNSLKESGIMDRTKV